MLDYYAARAVEYDQVYAKLERQSDLRAIEGWLPTALTGRTVLEVACGTGYWTQFYAPVARHVAAVDATEATLRIARARLPVDRVQLIAGDAYNLPVRRGGFDAAFAGFWWSHVPKGRIGAFLHGLHAHLAPGARVVFLDNRFVAGSSTPVSAPDAEGNTHQQRTLADGSIHRVLKNFPSDDELRACAAPHADDAQIHAWTHYWALTYTLRG